MNSRRLTGSSAQTEDHILPHPTTSFEWEALLCSTQQNRVPLRLAALDVISLEGSRGPPSMHFRYSPES